jgi:hypothetical protein
MAIKVKHGVDAGAAAAAAFGGAQGAARQRAAIGGAQAASAAEAQKRALAAQAEQATLGREHDLSRMTLGAELGETAAQAQHARSLASMGAQAGYQQAAADAAQARGRSDLEFSLTTRQKMELDQLADAEANALNDPQFSEEEKKELRYRFAQKRAGIQPVARPKPPTAAERFKERTYVDPRTGAIFPLDENGNPGNPIYQPPERQPTWQDRVKAVQVASAAAQGVDGKFNRVRFNSMMASMGFGPGGAAGAPGDASRQGIPNGEVSDEEAGERDFVPSGAYANFFDPNVPTGQAAGAAGAPAPPVPAGTPTPEDPTGVKSLGAEAQRITSAAPNTKAVTPAEMTDLPTVEVHMQAAREWLAEHKGKQDDLLSKLGKDNTDGERARARSRSGEATKAMRERLAQLEARQAALREQANTLELKQQFRALKGGQ